MRRMRSCEEIAPTLLARIRDSKVTTTISASTTAAAIKGWRVTYSISRSMSARSPAGGRKRERIIAAPHVFADFQHSRYLEYAHEDSLQRAPPGNLRAALAGARVVRCRRACRRRSKPCQGRG